MSVKMTMKMKNKDINRSTSRHVHKYSKYKKVRYDMLIYIKHQRSNILSSIHVKVKQH